jgi:6-phosphofructokinase 1
MSVKRVAIITGGGDCPGLNAVIRGAVKVGAERFGWEMLGVEDALNGLVDLDYRSPHGNLWLKSEDVRGILCRGGTILGTSNRSDPFEYVVKDASGQVTTVDVSDRVMDNYRKLGIDGLISIGGDGSMRITKRFMDKGMRVVGVPKTIDNDLGATDQTFGFDTAVQVAMEALDRLRDTAESHDRVMLCEVMGRDAGWIALHAGIAGGADAILIPEIPYRLEPIARMIEGRRTRGQAFSIVVVAEGAKPRGGEASIGEKQLGAMPRLVGAGQKVAHGLGQLLEADIRVTVLGHIQRGGSPSAFDRVLGTRFGHHAAELVAREEFGMMVALRGSEIVAVPIEEALVEPKRVRPDCQLVSSARAVGTVFGDET